MLACFDGLEVHGSREVDINYGVVVGGLNRWPFREQGLIDELKVALLALTLDLQKPKCSKTFLVHLRAKLEFMAFNGRQDIFGIQVTIFIIVCSDGFCHRDNDKCVSLSCFHTENREFWRFEYANR